jgi:hypothetical protein
MEISLDGGGDDTCRGSVITTDFCFMCTETTFTLKTLFLFWQ